MTPYSIETDNPNDLPLGDRAGIIERACRSRPRFDDPAAARAVAWRVRNRTMRLVRAHRCPFDDDADRHWHVGHVPSLPALRRVAAAIRSRRIDDGGPVRVSA